MFKNKRNSRTNKHIQIPVLLEQIHVESNMLGTWVNKLNIVQDSHTFLGITPKKIHTQISNVLDDFFISFLFFSFFSFLQALA